MEDCDNSISSILLAHDKLIVCDKCENHYRIIEVNVFYVLGDICQIIYSFGIIFKLD